MEFGCVFPNRGPMATPANLRRVAEQAEALGYDTVWLSDHIVIPDRSQVLLPVRPQWENALQPL